MDLKELYARGLALRQKMFGNAAVEKRMQAFGEFGAPLQTIINAYAYGDVWSRTALPDATRSLAMIGITAASNRSAELRVHAGADPRGAAAGRDVLRHSCRQRRPPRRVRGDPGERGAQGPVELRPWG